MMDERGAGTIVRTNVCVVGGGPAGLLLGTLLAKRGAEVIVLEGHPTFDREFRGEVLQPSTPRLLEQIGLLKYILEQPHLTLTAGQILVGGKTAAVFEFSKISPEYPYAIWMPQPVFLEALLKKATPFPGFSCWMGAHVNALVEENGVVVGVRGLRHGKEAFEIRADVVVGADGRHSTIRRLGGFATEYENHDFDIVWFVVDPPAEWARTIYVAFGKVPLLMLPKYPNTIQVGLQLRTGQWHDWRAEGVAAVAARLRAASPLFAGFADHLVDFTPFFPLPAIISLTRNWARDGLLLIGDAAHTMSPAGAIGVNVALATAAVAAQEIYPRLGRGTIAKKDLARIQKIREPDVRTLHTLQRGAGRALLGTSSGNSMIRWVLPRVLPMMVRLGLVPRVMRRIFFGVPLPPLDPEFGFQA